LEWLEIMISVNFKRMNEDMRSGVFLSLGVGIYAKYESKMDGRVWMLEVGIIEGWVGLENMVVKSQSLEFNG